MKSYEKELQDKLRNNEEFPPRIDISTLKYFWQASPLAGTRKDTIPKFLRKIEVLKNFADHELCTLSKYFHLRSFADNEVIFNQNDLGIGLYFVFSGNVNIVVGGENYHQEFEDETRKTEEYVLSLDKGDYFGELALLQDSNLRNGTAIAKESCQLLGIFKPDLEELIGTHPIVATRLLQSVSMIIANRLFSLTKEVGRLKFKLSQVETKA